MVVEPIEFIVGKRGFVLPPEPPFLQGTPAVMPCTLNAALQREVQTTSQQAIGRETFANGASTTTFPPPEPHKVYAPLSLSKSLGGLRPPQDPPATLPMCWPRYAKHAMYLMFMVPSILVITLPRTPTPHSVYFLVFDARSFQLAECVGRKVSDLAWNRIMTPCGSQTKDMMLL